MALDEFLINTTISEDQKTPSVARLDGGGFVVVWELVTFIGEGIETDIAAQVYDEYGIPQGGEFVVNASTRFGFGGQELPPQVAALSDGGFVVVWGQDSDGLDVRMRVFEANGLPRTADSPVASGLDASEVAPAVAGLSGGGFAVAWDDETDNKIAAQVYNASGGIEVSEFPVRAPGSGPVDGPAIAGLSNGDFVVGWSDFSSESPIVDARIVAANGTLGSIITAVSPGDESEPSIAGVSSGKFVLAWSDSGGEIYYEVFSNSGVSQLGPAIANVPSGYANTNPTVTAFSTNGFAISWEDRGVELGANSDIAVRLFDSAGAAIPGGQITVNTQAFGTSQLAPALAETENGGFIAVWEDEGGDLENPDTNTSSISGQLFDAAGVGVNAPVFGGSGDDLIDRTGTGGGAAVGKAGDDTYIVDGADDAIIEKPAEGDDTVQSSVSTTLADNVEDLLLTGTGNIDGTGNVLDNSITGNSGNNALEGGMGNDTLDGGAGAADEAVFLGNAVDFTILFSTSTITITDINTGDGDQGSDTAVNIEKLVFDDATIPVLQGGPADDTISLLGLADGVGIGGPGDDFYLVDDIGDGIVENSGEGTDEVMSYVSYQLPPNVENLSLVGTADGSGNDLDNTLVGDPEDHAGDNILTGKGGNDILDGGAGNDIAVFSGNAADYLISAVDGSLVVAHVNVIDDDDGTDSLQNIDLLRFADQDIIVGVGGPGDNVFDLTGPGGGQVYGGPGNDTYIVDDPLDEPIEEDGEGDDTVQASLDWILGPFLDILLLTGIMEINGTGNTLANVLIGNIANNLLAGGEGDDILIGGAGNDELFGGFQPGFVPLAVPLADLAFSPIGFTTQLLPATDDNIFGTDGIDVAVFSGESGDYEITVTPDAVIVEDLNPGDGDDGTDTLHSIEILRFTDKDVFVELGTPIDDSLDLTDAEGDTAAGGDGNDTYRVDDAADTVIEFLDEGIDTILSTVSWILGLNLENLTLLGSQPLNGTGNALSNLLLGNPSNNVLRGLAGVDDLDGGRGDDVLDGGSGADSMRGGPGNDTYFVDDPNDQVVETVPATLFAVTPRGGMRRGGGEVETGIGIEDIADNIDEVVATVSYALTDFVENLTLAGAADIDGSGNELDNAITGNSSDNALSTGSGSLDTLAGGDGDDRFLVDKLTGRTLIEDTPGGADVLDLSIFAAAGELVFRDTSGASLRIENSSGGVVELTAFYGPGGKSIQYLDAGNGPMDISAANDAGDVAVLSGLASLGTLVDDDDNYWDAAIETNDGTLIPAAEAQLYRSYLGGLGRQPDQGGYDWWLNEINEGRHDLNSMAAGFVFSPEFQFIADGNGDGSVSSSEFVNHMYENVFGRTPDSDGFAYWTGELDSGNKSQPNVLVEMTQSNEFVLQTVDATVNFLDV